MNLVLPDHRFDYRDGEGNILAEWDDPDTDRHAVMRTLMAEGHAVLRSYVDGRPTLGTYGDVG